MVYILRNRQRTFQKDTWHTHCITPIRPFTITKSNRKTVMKKLINLALAATSLFAFAAVPASAITYNLTTGNSAISGYNGPYGSVTVILNDATHATITFS